MKRVPGGVSVLGVAISQNGYIFEIVVQWCYGKSVDWCKLNNTQTYIVGQAFDTLSHRRSQSIKRAIKYSLFDHAYDHADNGGQKYESTECAQCNDGAQVQAGSLRCGRIGFDAERRHVDIRRLIGPAISTVHKCISVKNELRQIPQRNAHRMFTLLAISLSCGCAAWITFNGSRFVTVVTVGVVGAVGVNGVDVAVGCRLPPDVVPACWTFDDDEDEDDDDDVRCTTTAGPAPLAPLIGGGGELLACPLSGTCTLPVGTGRCGVLRRSRHLNRARNVDRWRRRRRRCIICVHGQIVQVVDVGGQCAARRRWRRHRHHRGVARARTGGPTGRRIGGDDTLFGRCDEDAGRRLGGRWRRRRRRRQRRCGRCRWR